ncbi:MAG: methylenetetrahydrofolate reductase [Candidatus Marinimicrobia bacterium]|nr:methylenetetrahydrofolate reductase [Candidatus Neomarinimicrobiota bacterium]MCF7827370.1 methylenetetrahydrofolate reductase [Candidatus Neomarinimicrobiota bacterium]MCF7881397.1 methylenetetrahydrofolate reductase [Candidatus Neomarinimicrobiota bacterium]
MEFTPRLTKLADRFGTTPIVFELAPPKKGAHKERLRQHRDGLQQLTNRVDINGINLPEIQDESQQGDRGQRRSKFEERVAPRKYANQLSEKVQLRYLINRVIVKQPAPKQEKWIANTFHNYGIDSIVIVGGESSEKEYPGLSVPSGNRLVRKYLNQGKRKYADTAGPATDLLVGNICIPTRRRDDLDEPERMLQKVQAGADFFTTQIIAESNSPIKLLEDLSRLFVLEDVSPPMLFWSFTPIASQKDVDFLRWLGVFIPDNVENKILSSDEPATTSIEYTGEIWEHLLELNRNLPRPFPMGCNISVMGMRNFENAVEMAATLKERTKNARNHQRKLFRKSVG